MFGLFGSGARVSQRRSCARTPTLFHTNVLPTRPFLAIPQVSSERREYIPIAWLSPPVVPSDKVRVMLDATPWQFGIITSRMHMAWTRTITGRLKSDYMYSIGIVYNNFPWPVADEAARARVEALAQGVLSVRAAYPNSTLADLYDPRTMPPNLRRAHQGLDAAVDRLRPAAFRDDGAGRPACAVRRAGASADGTGGCSGATAAAEGVRKGAGSVLRGGIECASLATAFGKRACERGQVQLDARRLAPRKRSRATRTLYGLKRLYEIVASCAFSACSGAGDLHGDLRDASEGLHL